MEESIFSKGEQMEGLFLGHHAHVMLPLCDLKFKVEIHLAEH